MNIEKLGSFHKIGLIRNFKEIKREFGLKEFYRGVGIATVFSN